MSTSARAASAAQIIRSEVDPKIDALSPANKLIFATGPLTGTFAPSAGRYNVVTKGPLNDALAASNSGGAFGPELKYAGYDARHRRGQGRRSPSTSGSRTTRSRSATPAAIWGKTVPDTTDLIRAETDDEAKVACIGPAGEHLALFANIMNDMHRAAGRTGVGAVMGSKNLKAVAVVGTGAVTVADPEALPGRGAEGAPDDLRRPGRRHRPPGLRHRRARQHPQPDRRPAHAQLAGRLLPHRRQDRRRGPGGQAARPQEGLLQLHHLVRPRHQGRRPRLRGHAARAPSTRPPGPTAPTAASTTSTRSPRPTTSATSTAWTPSPSGSTIACAMELFQRGIITTKDTDGVDLTWGNAKAIVEMTRKMGEGDGFGAKLAQGSYRLADGYGHPEYSMTAKKQEMPAYDARAIQGIGLNYATSNRGGCHVRGYTISHEVLQSGGSADPHVTEGKAGLDIAFQNLTAALDATGVLPVRDLRAHRRRSWSRCWPRSPAYDYTLDEFLQVGDRIWNQERLWNLGGRLHQGRRHAAQAAARRAAQERRVQGPRQQARRDAARVLRRARLGRERRADQGEAQGALAQGMTVKYFATIRDLTREKERRDRRPAGRPPRAAHAARGALRPAVPARRVRRRRPARRDHHLRQRAQRAAPADAGHAARGRRRGLDLPDDRRRLSHGRTAARIGP